jgi:hypothetical protein
MFGDYGADESVKWFSDFLVADDLSFIVFVKLEDLSFKSMTESDLCLML